MASKAGSTVKPKPNLPKLPAKVVNTNLDNITLSPGTLAILDSIFGSEAAFVHDPIVGPLILQVAKDGITDTARIKDYFMTHAVNSSGKIETVVPEKSWLGSQGSAVRTAIIEQKTNIGTYNENVDSVLQNWVIPEATKLGINLDSASLKIVAENAYRHGWGNSQVAIDNAITAQYHYDPTAAANLALQGKSVGGLTSTTQEDFTKIAADYGITLPKDPTQMENFIKGAIGPNGTEQAFKDWAKQQAIHAYPFLADAITNGSTVKGYLGNYATNIANTLDIAPDSINWSDPKWQSLVNPVGATKLPNLNDILTVVKTDPKYGYDQTMTAKNNAYDLAASIKSTFGFGKVG